MSDQYDEIIIPEDAGLMELRQLLARAENRIKQLTPKLSQYRIDNRNTRGVYTDLLSDAKVIAMEKHDLGPNHQTMINAYANSNPNVKLAKAEWQLAKAKLTKAEDYMNQLMGQRDTLKAMVKSEQPSY